MQTRRCPPGALPPGGCGVGSTGRAAVAARWPRQARNAHNTHIENAGRKGGNEERAREEGLAGNHTTNTII